VRVQGRMTYPTWTDKQTGATRYGAEIVAQTLDYQGANDEDDAQAEQPAVEAPAPQPAETTAGCTGSNTTPTARRRTTSRSNGSPG